MNGMPFLLPMIQQMQQQQNQEGFAYTLPPLRIRVAMEFLKHLAHKTDARAASSDSQVLELERQQLTTGESNAQLSACNLLIDYFRGKLSPDKWEKEVFEQVRKEEDPAHLGRIIHCFSCSPNPPKPSCIFCHGSGSVLVVPTS